MTIATADDVLDLTGYSADDVDVKRAQAIVEAYAGRTESLITDVEDLAWMKYAIAWQVAYMATDGNSVYEQANIETLTQNDTTISFGGREYAIAPLALKAIGRLSWNRSRSITTAPPFGVVECEPWEVV